MKKAAIIFLLAALGGGIAFAQTEAAVTVNGTLGVSAGRIAVKSGTLTYYPGGLERLVGFIDGLKEGAEVTMEGYVSAPYFESQTERMFFPVNLTLDGKTYDLDRGTAFCGGMCRSWPGNRGGGYGMGNGYGGGGMRNRGGMYDRGGGYGGRGRF